MDTPDGGHRPLVRETTLEEYRKEPELRAEEEEEPAPGLTLYKPYPYKEEDYAWGMAIDLNSCVGCNNCMVACQSENNIAVVGKEQTRHRPPHALDSRRRLLPGRPRQSQSIISSPYRACNVKMRPAKWFAPWARPTTRSEGLNDMVYNRCVGTRYCSNNCPYKVRRFNFLLFQDWETPQYKMMRNPDVSVRSRGVMEKCTYCVQRINEHRIDAETASVREGKQIKIRDDELQTACQQSCPAERDHLRQHQRPEQQGFEVEGAVAELQSAGRIEYAAADHVSGGSQQSEPGVEVLELGFRLSAFGCRKPEAEEDLLEL